MIRYIITILLVLISVHVWAAGIRDEIFYLEKDNTLQIVTANFSRLKTQDVPELIAILKDSLDNKPIETIIGKYRVTAIAQGELILKLAELADPRGKNIVVEYLKRSTDRFNREVAAVSLGSFGDPAVIPLLREALADKDPVLQLYSARSLGELKDVSGYEIALKYLHSEDKTLKIQAMYALAMIGKEEALPWLRAEQKDPVYREAATLAEKKIGFDHLPAGDKPGFLDEVLKNNAGETAYWAANEYLKLGPGYVPNLRKIAGDNSYRGRETADEILREKNLTDTGAK